jgi:hypothetical protein
MVHTPRLAQATSMIRVLVFMAILATVSWQSETLSLTADAGLAAGELPNSGGARCSVSRSSGYSN